LADWYRWSRLLNQRGTIVTAGRLGDVELVDDLPATIGIEDVQDGGSFVAHTRGSVGEDVAHIGPQAVLIVAKPVPDEDRPDAVVERKAVGEFSFDEGAGRQPLADERGRRHVLVGAQRRPLAVLHEVSADDEEKQSVRENRHSPPRQPARYPRPGGI
jgi:hypothetical protein